MILELKKYNFIAIKIKKNCKNSSSFNKNKTGLIEESIKIKLSQEKIDSINEKVLVSLQGINSTYSKLQEVQARMTQPLEIVTIGGLLYSKF